SRTSFTLASGQNTASGDRRKISATAPASSARNVRIADFARSRPNSVAMRRAAFPENLRIRPPHVIRVESQRVGRPPFLQSPEADASNDSGQRRGNLFGFFPAPFAIPPSRFGDN